MKRKDSLEKTLVMEKIERKKRKRRQRVRWLDGRCNEHEFGEPLGDSGGQGGLESYGPWGRKGLGMI